MKSYLGALAAYGWAWGLAAAFVLVNAVSLLIEIAAGDEPVVFVIAFAALIGLACWLFSKGDALARQSIDGSQRGDGRVRH